MGKKSKSKSESKPSEVEGAKGNDSSDIFKLLFGREAPEEQGLGLGIDSNPRSGEINLQGEFDTKEASIDSGELKKKKKKREKTNLDANAPEAIDEESEIVKKSKKKKEVNAESIDEVYKKEKKGKRKKELKQDSDVDSVVTTDEVKKSKKENDGEVLLQVIPNVDKSLEQKGEEVGDLKDKRKKKKRKRDEIEEAYEAKAYGVVANVVEGDKKGTRKVGEKRKSMDDPAEMMVSKEGFDDETKLLRTVFVGNLPLKLKKKALLKEFTKFGEVESVRIRSIPIVDSKTPRKGAIMKGKINESVDSVNAYIVFKDEKSAQASLSHNMAVVEGNHIRVDKACPPRKKLKGDNTPVYDNQRTVFVGNLPFDVKDEEIYQLFCGDQSESNIEAVRVIRDPNSSVGKGIAYVLFKTKEAANLVIKKRHLKIRERILRFYHARSDATPSKKRNLPNTSAENSRGKRLAVTSPFSHEDKNRSKTKTALSYQGLKASKTIQKKEAPKKDGFRPRSGEHGKQKSSSASGGEVKDRKNKRPAVAARKAKALKSVGASKQAGLKRKPESRTPDSLHRNKKTRKLK